MPPEAAPVAHIYDENYVWLDGLLIKSAEANLHVFTHSLHNG